MEIISNFFNIDSLDEDYILKNIFPVSIEEENKIYIIRCLLAICGDDNHKKYYAFCMIRNMVHKVSYKDCILFFDISNITDHRMFRYLFSCKEVNNKETILGSKVFQKLKNDMIRSNIFEFGFITNVCYYIIHRFKYGNSNKILFDNWDKKFFLMNYLFEMYSIETSYINNRFPEIQSIFLFLGIHITKNDNIVETLFKNIESRHYLFPIVNEGEEIVYGLYDNTIFCDNINSGNYRLRDKDIIRRINVPFDKFDRVKNIETLNKFGTDILFENL